MRIDEAGPHDGALRINDTMTAIEAVQLLRWTERDNAAFIEGDGTILDDGIGLVSRENSAVAYQPLNGFQTRALSAASARLLARRLTTIGLMI
jgi:hypothetical protein